MSIEANIALIVKRLGELREELKHDPAEWKRIAIVKSIADYEKNLAQIAEALGKGGQSEADFEEWQDQIKRPRNETRPLYLKPKERKQ